MSQLSNSSIFEKEQANVLAALYIPTYLSIDTSSNDYALTRVRVRVRALILRAVIFYCVLNTIK